MARKKTKVIEHVEIPPAVYAIACRRGAEGRRAALKVPSLTMEELLVGMYLQGIEDMGVAMTRVYGLPRKSVVPEFEVM